MFLGCSGTTWWGGKLVFFYLSAATASWGCTREGRRLQVTVPNGANRVRASLLVAYGYGWACLLRLPLAACILVSSKASIVQSGLFSINYLGKKAVLERQLRGESSAGDHFYSSEQLWRPKIAVRYAAAVLKPMSAHGLSLPRATYGGAHH